VIYKYYKNSRGSFLRSFNSGECFEIFLGSLGWLRFPVTLGYEGFTHITEEEFYKELMLQELGK
jgi:hypothetical protein